MTTVRNRRKIAISEIEFQQGSGDHLDYTILHRYAKWHKMRSQGGPSVDYDTFSDDVSYFNYDGKNIQATHTYIDTIYMHKGQSISLAIPDKMNASVSASAYQRWYNFRTDGLLCTNQADGVYDLLTPSSGQVGSRMANGYVGSPLHLPLYSVDFYYPTDTEFDSWEGALGQEDNNFYLVAADVSPYRDFYNPDDYQAGSSNNGQFIRAGSTECYEPTLSHRALFYIVGVDNHDDTDEWTKGHGRLTDSNYQGGGNEEDKRYLEEYEISMPFTRISNHTNELVSLSKDAWSYAIPGVSANEDTKKLDITIADNDNDAGIALVSTSISDGNRRIFFTYPNQDEEYGTRTVNDPNNDGVSTATILVTKTVGETTYNIARYRLTFRAEASLLTWSQLEQIREGKAEGKPWEHYDFRVPENLDNNPSLRLLNKLDFDYDPDVAQTIAADGNYQPNYYPFPLEWGSSSYSFYDGATCTHGELQEFYENGQKRQYAQWGFYALMSDYQEYGGSTFVAPNPLYEGDTYHLYIDASDRPGIIAQLPFEVPLCAGSELFVTAWVKSANASDDDAAMLFTIMGVGADGSMTPLYRHYTGQIRRTDVLNSHIPGCGGDHQEWWQLYFSFINEGTANAENEQADFVSYVLQVENYCASTRGGDFCLDNIHVYIAQPSAEVTQLESTCVGEATKMNIAMDWNRLASRLGIDDETADENTTRYLDIAFLDLTKFQQDMEEVGGITELEDFQQYLIPVYGQVNELGEVEGDGAPIASIAFKEVFASNLPYKTDQNNWAFPENNYKEGHFFWAGSAETNDRRLLADFYSTLTPNYPYVLLVRTRTADEERASAEDFLYDYKDPCAINTEFRVTSQAILKVNGEIVRPDVTYCAGNIFNFSTQVQIPYVDVEEGDPNEHYLTVEHGVYFDWFFGTEDEYITENETYGVSLRNALLAFREVYPDAEILDEIQTPLTDGFTEEMYNLIQYYLEKAPAPEGGHNRPLVLHRENINITFLETGLYLVVQPIKTVTPPGGLTLPDGKPVDENHWNAICWEYIPLRLDADDSAPELHAGFGTVNYPDGVEPGLRIGRKQIEAVKSGNTDSNTLTVQLRDARASSEDIDVSYLGMVRESVDDYNRIFLVGTNDPTYERYFGAANYDPYSLPIGTIQSLHANVEAASNNVGTMEITFDLGPQTIYAGTEEEETDFTFAPREGYYYTFLTRFEEYTGSGTTAAVTNSCVGSFTVTMYVVPEYLVWQGTATGNWNNDRNWHRADAEELNYEGTEYVTNAENYVDAAEDTKASAYVPMLFSKVIIPTEHPIVELYPAGFMIGESREDWGSEKPDYIESPTANIQYDLMVYERNLADPSAQNLPRFSTQKYRVALCDQIHFEPGTQMLHSQYLLYNKAWVDVVVPTKQWTNVSVPLRDVVAGDWYTQASGSDAELPYFTDMTKREQGVGSPYVYQRSWGPNVSIIERSGTTGVSFSATEWSAAYNDAYVPYTAGAGFSLKAAEGTGENTEQLLFRLPKSDDSYAVTSGGVLSRANAGKLAALRLFTRNKDSYSGETTATNNQSFSVELQPSEDGQYFIVGNPFVSHLDVQKFLEANQNVLEPEYWLTVEDGDPMVAITGVFDVNNGEWVSSSTNAFVPPYGAFYVKRASAGTGSVEVKFTADMQSLNLSSADAGTTTTQGLSMEAANEAGRSTALVAFAGRADDGFAEGEDVQLVDFGAGATVPLVYSVAGQKAAAINRLNGAQQIPLGVYAADEEEPVTVAFRGVNNLAEATLYDAEMQTETPLTEGYTLTLKGSSHGRYFLRAAGDFTGLDELPEGDASQVSVYSPLPGELIVAAAGMPLERVLVYDTAGALRYDSGALSGDVCKATGIPTGTYVVQVQANGTVRSYKVALQ